ncbi:Syntaxin-10 [Coemansia thaxteri]|uniref:Syntaxin-10 n=1 Tax=Coemansia thaxteri TaxID=2663907 RepID=A0A9W8BKS6_9FUNG|nr:Syntaxin-10 [Coemansia thaxteri]KAJ2005493.1 Syntaxin-10 [Coemansia thaxteri]KAJ2485427.1 Syntaxin-10 [Coemansia sp. RSA 2320]
MSDPFVIVQEDVTSAFEQAKTLLASWKHLSRKRRSAQDENEYQFVTDEIYSTATSIGTDLNELQETIDIARAAPGDYGLTPAQISERQAFVATGRKALDEMRRTLGQPAASSTRAGGARGGAAGSQTAQSEHHAVEFGSHQGQQQMLMEQQDEHLDAMLDTVRNLHGMAGTINTELDDQAILLDEMGEMVENTQSKLSAARNKVDKFLRDKSNRSVHIILILFVVILVLIMLVIFT